MRPLSSDLLLNPYPVLQTRLIKFCPHTVKVTVLYRPAQVSRDFFNPVRHPWVFNFFSSHGALLREGHSALEHEFPPRHADVLHESVPMQHLGHAELKYAVTLCALEYLGDLCFELLQVMADFINGQERDVITIGIKPGADFKQGHGAVLCPATGL